MKTLTKSIFLIFSISALISCKDEPFNLTADHTQTSVVFTANNCQGINAEMELSYVVNGEILGTSDFEIRCKEDSLYKTQSSSSYVFPGDRISFRGHLKSPVPLNYTIYCFKGFQEAILKGGKIQPDSNFNITYIIQ